jgi:outer membrane immunogenic protein
MNKYFKRLAFAHLSLLFLATSAFASGAYMPPAKPYFDGFYGGIGMGAVAALSDVKTSHEFTGSLSLSTTKLSDGSRDLDLGKGGFNANIFVGYGKTLNSSYYLGGELFGNYFTPKATGSYTEKNISNIKQHKTYDSVENRYSFGGDLRAGYLVSPHTMLYILFGLDYAKFKVNSETNTIVDTPENSETFAINNNFSKWKLGYMPGVGIETGLTDHLSIRVQGTYTYFPSFSHSNTKDFIIDDSNIKSNTDTKVKPSRWLFTVMLSYLFN